MDHLFLQGRGFFRVRLFFSFRHFSVGQHVRRAHVGKELELRHEFGHVVEGSHPLLHLVAHAFGAQFHLRGDFREVCCPCVEVGDTFVLQDLRRQVALERIQLRHGVGNRRAGREDEAAIVRLLVHVLRLHVEIPRHVRVLLAADAASVRVARLDLEVLVVMDFIDDELVDAELVERNAAVSFRLVLLFERPRLRGELFDGVHDFLDAEVFFRLFLHARRRKFIVASLEAGDLVFGHLAFELRRKLQALERGEGHDHGIPILCGDLRGESLAIHLLEILFRRHEDFRAWIKLVEGVARLRDEMVRHDHHRLLGKPHAL